ncbi:MAG TPA: hypothetical protein V6C98_15845 [Thermosynechococcaceae cyanobacterium]
MKQRSVLVYPPDRLPHLFFGANHLPVLDGIACNYQLLPSRAGCSK